MPKPRKVRVEVEETENKPPKITKKKTSSKETPAKKLRYEPDWLSGDGRTVVNLILSVQKSEINSVKVLAQLNKLYNSMGHKIFTTVLMKMVVMFLTRKEHDEFAPRLLKFIGSFVASFGEEIAEDGGSHAIVTQIFDEILSITSKHHYIRARICIFITNVMSSFSQHAEISENIMDNVVERMTILMRDVSPAVRQNAIMALQRLQDPENSEDPVTRAYIYHMETDPVAKVRQAAITAIAKKLPTMNFVLDRLQDNDEKVRRHTFLQMASFPVRSYKIVDRIKILDSGLNDRSEMVKKTVLNILLPNWIAAYENNYTDFIKAIKLDSNDSELKKFSNLAEDALSAVFKKRKIEDLIGFLGLEANNCLTVDKANSLEWLTVWKVVMKIFIELKSGEVDGEEKSDEEEEQLIQQQKDIVPELTVLCEYIEKFITEFKSPTGSEAKYQKLNFNHCIITLLEIVQLNDFSDLVGCEKLKTLIKTILVEHDASDHVIKKIVDVVEQLILPVEARIAYFNGIVMEMVKMGTPGEYSRQAIIDDLIAKADIDTKVKANSLKMQMMELKEQEINFVEKKQYASAQRVTEQYAAISGQLIELLRPLASDSSASQSLVSLENLSSVAVAKKITPSEIIKNLRICFFAIMTKGVKTMTHECMNIYNDFVRYHLESSDLLTRVWALKTATAYSMLYESLAKEVYVVLKTQMMTSDNAMIWETTIGCVIDLFLRYSLTKMEQRDETIQDINGTGGTQRNKKGGRMLYTDDGEDAEGVDITVDVIQMLVLVLDNNADQQVYKASLVGLSKLILHGQYCTRELMSKFLLSYFNPATDPEINQILGIFFESIIRMKKQESLHDALIPTLVTLFEAPADSPLREVKTETVLKYVIGATRPVFCSNGLNLHNTLGLKLLEFMSDNLENREIHRVFAKELLLLEIGDDPLLKKDMVVKIEALLAGISVDLRTKKKISDFRDMLKGCYKKALKFSSTAMENLDGEPEIVESEDEEKVAEEEKFTADDIMDISSSGVVMKDVQINVTKLELSGIQKDEEMTEPGEVSDGSKVSEVLETSEILANQTQVPATQDPAASSTQNDSNLNDSVDLPATQSYDSEPSSEDEEINVTVKSVAPTFTESEEIIPATPETPVRAKRIITNKRHLDVSKSINSPLRKQSKSDEPTIVTPKTPKTSSTMIASPKTPRFSTLPQSKSSTPNTDRQTRKQAREEIAQTSKLTRSTSKKMNVDPVEIAEKAEEMAKTIQATKSATKIEKAASVKQKAAAEKANPTIEITAPSNEKTAPAKRLTRKAAAAKISQGKESKPRWR